MSRKSLVEQFINTSALLRRIIHRACTVSFEEKLTTTLQFQALDYLNEHKKCTVGELAKELVLSSSAVAQLSDRMQTAGWIIRTHDENDRRVTHIGLSSAGRKEYDEMKLRYIKRMDFLLSQINEKDLSELIRIQTELITKLDKNNIVL